MDEIVIRNIKEEDIPSVVDIQINGWKTAYRGIVDDEYLDTLDREAIIEKRRKKFKENKFIVAEKNKEIVGFCWYVDDNSFSLDATDIDCELIALYVRPDLKYNGIGTKLFQFVINKFKEKNKTKMILWCLKNNEPSKNFYTKMGGSITREKMASIGGKEYLEVGFTYKI